MSAKFVQDREIKLGLTDGDLPGGDLPDGDLPDHSCKRPMIERVYKLECREKADLSPIMLNGQNSTQIFSVGHAGIKAVNQSFF